MKERTPVFVYGTLLRGESNSALMRKAKYVGEATTKPEYELVDFGWYPAMVSGGKTSIRGEVYLVDDAQLADIDRLEGYPGFYTRETIQLADGAMVSVYTLSAKQAGGRPVIASGDWRERDGKDRGN